MKKILLFLLVIIGLSAMGQGYFYVPARYAQYLLSLTDDTNRVVIFYNGVLDKTKGLDYYYNYYDNLYPKGWVFKLTPVPSDSIQTITQFDLTK